MDRTGPDRTGTDRIGSRIHKSRMRFSVFCKSNPIQIDPERILKSLKKIQRFFDPMTRSERIDFISQWMAVLLSRGFNEIQKDNLNSAINIFRSTKYKHGYYYARTNCFK